MDNQDPNLPLLDAGLAPKADTPPPRRPSPLLLGGAAGLLLMIGAVGGVYVQGPWVRAFFGVTGLEPGGGAIRAPMAVAPPEAPAPTETARGIVALGHLQPLGSVIEVAAPSTAGSPRVLDVLVHEGDVAAFDAPLVILDTYPTLLAGRDAAQRAVAVAEAALSQVERDVGVGRQESQAAVAAARSASEQASREKERNAGLFAGGAVPQSTLDAATSAADQARAELERADASARRFSTNADIQLAERNLEAARADLARAEAELRNATVLAPSTGTVLSVKVQPGERASSGTLLSLADLSRMEAEIEVYQESVGGLAIGQPVRITSPVLESPLTGTVRRIGLEVGRQTVISSDPAAATDARVVKAWVDIDPTFTATAARFVGLEIVAHIDVPAPK